MNYDKIIKVNLEDCEIISRVVETEEIQNSSTFNIWMFENKVKKTQTPIAYLVYIFEGTKYISEPIYHSLDLIRLKILRQKTTYLYLNTSKGNYFFDLDFLKD